MWLSLLAAIIIVGFLSTSFWLKIYFKKESNVSEINCKSEKNKAEKLSACDHCGLKDLTGGSGCKELI